MYHNHTKPLLLLRNQPQQLSDNFNSAEFFSRNDDNEVAIIYPGLVALLQDIRNEVGFPIKVNSGYRSYEHNKRIGGAPASTHLFGMAADLTGQDLEAIEQSALRLGAGGVKRYDTFVHVDIWVKRTW